MLREVGLDAYVALRCLRYVVGHLVNSRVINVVMRGLSVLHRFGFVFFAALTPVVMLINVPIYSAQRNDPVAGNPGIALVSLSNVPSEMDWIFWVRLHQSLS